MNRWLYLLVCNTPPIDWIGFLGFWPRFFERLEEGVNFDDLPELSYNRKLEIFAFTENVLIYLALGVVLGIAFKGWSTMAFVDIMLKIWSIAYATGILADAFLLHEGLYFPAYKRFKGINLMKILKLYVFTAYHSALYAVFGIAVGRLLLPLSF